MKYTLSTGQSLSGIIRISLLCGYLLHSVFIGAYHPAEIEQLPINSSPQINSPVINSPMIISPAMLGLAANG